MIEVILNDRLGKKIRVKCNPDDTIGTYQPCVRAVGRSASMKTGLTLEP